jgi:S-DNA-T family DNA segregation ATPase FtsK/SpoIIIE
MYEEALGLVLEHRYASPSFLQRKLRIGYTRAAQLIDALEERGIVGPPGEGKDGSRPVLEQPAQEEAGV